MPIAIAEKSRNPPAFFAWRTPPSARSAIMTAPFISRKHHDPCRPETALAHAPVALRPGSHHLRRQKRHRPQHAAAMGFAPSAARRADGDGIVRHHPGQQGLPLRHPARHHRPRRAGAGTARARRYRAGFQRRERPPASRRTLRRRRHHTRWQRRGAVAAGLPAAKRAARAHARHHRRHDAARR